MRVLEWLVLIICALTFHVSAAKRPIKGKGRGLAPISAPEHSEASFESEERDEGLAQHQETLEEDQLANDEGNDDLFGPSSAQHVRFATTPPGQTQNALGNGTIEETQELSSNTSNDPEASAHTSREPPTTPGGVGRLHLALGRAPEDTTLYERPGAAERKGWLSGVSDEQLDREFHSWYQFSKPARRRIFHEDWCEVRRRLYDISAATGASFFLAMSRPEADPAHPNHFGDTLISRNIARNRRFQRTTDRMWTMFEDDVARVYREEHKKLLADSAVAGQEDEDASPQHGDDDEETMQVNNPPKKRKRENKARAADASRSKGKTKENASDEDRADGGIDSTQSTPQRPRTRQRTSRDRASRETRQSPPRFALATRGRVLDTRDMAVDDEEEVEQLGQALVHSRRETEDRQRQREQPTASTSRLDSQPEAGPSSSRQRIDMAAGLPPVDARVKLEQKSSKGKGKEKQRDASPAPSNGRAAGTSTGSVSSAAGPRLDTSRPPITGGSSRGPATAGPGSSSRSTNASGPARTRQVLDAVELPRRFAVPAPPRAQRPASIEQALLQTISPSNASLSFRAPTPNDAASEFSVIPPQSPPASAPPTESEDESDGESMLPAVVQGLLDEFGVRRVAWDDIETIYLTGLGYGAEAHARWTAALREMQAELRLTDKQVKKVALAMLRAQAVKKSGA